MPEGQKGEMDFEAYIENLGRSVIASVRFAHQRLRLMVSSLGDVSIFVYSTLLSTFKRPLGFELLRHASPTDFSISFQIRRGILPKKDERKNIIGELMKNA